MTEQNSLFRLDGQVALVTGGNGGIGLAIARALGAHGATVAVTGRKAAKTDKAAKGLVEEGIHATAHVFDLIDAKSCSAMVEDVINLHGSLRILVNCAGINLRKRPELYTEAELEQILRIDLIVPFHMSVAAYRVAMCQSGGSIINIGSLLSTFGGEKFAPYSMAKGGLVQMTRSMAVAWARENVRVNAILPGWIETDLTRSARETVLGLNEKVLCDTPFGRWGRPEEISGAAVMLAGAASGFTTGATIRIDGGFGIAI